MKQQKNKFSKIHLIEVVDYNKPLQIEQKSLGLGYLASYAEKYGGYKNIKIYQSSDDIIFEELPEIVGISSVTQNFEIAKKLIKNIKRISKNTKIILGGIHISLMPNSVIDEVDYVVLGEGEQTFLELLNYIYKKNKKINTIKGILYKKNNKFISTKYRDLISDLDSIPFPKRDFKFIKNQTAHLFTSRGCPYNCPFCSSSKLWKTVRFNSAKYVIKELSLLIDTHHASKIAFADDLFIANKFRLNKICGEIKKRKWHKQVSFVMNVRANLITKELVDVLKSINTTYVGIGLETGSERMIKIMKGGSVSIEQNYLAVKLLKEAGIKVDGYFMMGYPGETLKDIEKTREFIVKSNIDFGQTMIAMPYPGTELWNIALKKRIVSPTMNWSKFQADFEADTNNTLIVSEIDRKILFEQYMKFKELWLLKNIQQSGNLFNYFKRLNYRHLILMIKEPKKIKYILSALYRYIFRK